MSEVTDSAADVGEEVTAEDKFYLEWARESLKNNLRLTNEILRQLLTLNGVFLGGSTILLNDDVFPRLIQPVAIAIFLGALVISFIGVLPYTRKVHMQSPSRIKQHKKDALRHKIWCIRLTALLMALGFGTLFFGLIAR